MVENQRPHKPTRQGTAAPNPLVFLWHKSFGTPAALARAPNAQPHPCSLRWRGASLPLFGRMFSELLLSFGLAHAVPPARAYTWGHACMVPVVGVPGRMHACMGGSPCFKRLAFYFARGAGVRKEHCSYALLTFPWCPRAGKDSKNTRPCFGLIGSCASRARAMR